MTFDATHYRIRRMGSPDFAAIGTICRRVYPHDAPYTDAELATHNALYPEGQFVAEYLPTAKVVGVHFTLRLRLADFHIDDSWDVLTAHGSFSDHDPVHGHTLYGADVFVSPEHQHHGLAHALTDATRRLVVEQHLAHGGRQPPARLWKGGRDGVARTVSRRDSGGHTHGSCFVGPPQRRLVGRQAHPRISARRL